MAEDPATGWADTALSISEVAVPAACLALGVVVIVHTWRTASHPRLWLASGAVVLVLVSFSFRPLAPLWFAAFPLLAATFPDGRFVPRWLVVPVVLSVVPTTAELVRPDTWSEQSWWFVFAWAEILLVGAQVYRYRRRATTEERESARWLILGTLLTVAYFVILGISFGEIGEGSTASILAAQFAILPLALGLVAGVVRPRGLDVDRALHAAILGFVAVPVLALIYAAVSSWLGNWAGAAAVGLATLPVGLGARWIADWVVYRGRPSANEAVSRMLARLGQRTAGDSVPAIVLDSALESVYLDGGQISGEWFATLSRGTTQGTQDFPIMYRGEEVAVMSLAPRPTESAFTARDRRVIAALAAHAAPALHGDRVLTDLHESRQRVVSAREEERRRLRRDLHDDLGPALSGLSLSAAALARRTGLPEADELHEDIQQAMLQSRRIAYGLRPPVLDDHGLAAAIVDRTAADDDLEIRVTAPDGFDLPAAVDLAALRIVTEAVANVRKHAEATAVDVALSIADGHLEITVSDDGVGLPEDVRPGIGMHSIAERAAEVGGAARYDRTAAGTHLRVRLPLGST